MKRYLFKVITILTLILFLNSCEKSESLEFEKIDHTKILRSKHLSDSIMGYCKVDIQYLTPIAGVKGEILKKIQDQLLVCVFDSTYIEYNANAAVDTFIASTFDRYANEFQKISSQPNIKLNNEEWLTNTIILFNDNGILSYELSKYSKLGDYIKMDNTQYLVFDIESGNRIKQGDIFVEGSEDKISELLKEQIMFDNSFKSEEEMINNGYFFSVNIVPNNNFSVTERGISFLYNLDEIAVYSLGPIEVSLSFNKLKPYLKKKTAISHLFEE